MTLTAAALGVLIAAAGATVAVLHWRHERALDRAALADVHLSVAYDSSSLSAGVEIVNDGLRAVTLLSAAVDAPGYGEENPGLLGPGESSSFVLTDTRACTPALLTSQPRNLVISGKTSRGEHFRRSIPIATEALGFARLDDENRCGYQPVEASFLFDVTSFRMSGKDLIVHTAIANESVLPLTVVRFESLDYVTVRPSSAVPISLPPASAPGAIQWVALTLTLHVSDCIGPNMTGGGNPLPFDSVGWVHLRREGTNAQVPLVFEPSLNQDGETVGPAPVAVLYKRACGITLPGEGAPPGG